MALSVSVYNGDDIAFSIRPKDNLDGWKKLDTPHVSVLEITDLDMLPEVGAMWVNEEFDVTPIPNAHKTLFHRFAFVVDDVCVAITEFPKPELDFMAEQLRKVTKFEVNEIKEGKSREVKPWDLLNPNTEYVSKEIAKSRLDICKTCPFLIKATHQCKKCGCFMHLKTKLADATCPVGKW